MVRQNILTALFLPGFHWRLFLTHGVSAAVFLAGLALSLPPVLSPAAIAVAACLLTGQPGYAGLVVTASRLMLPEHRKEITALLPAYLALTLPVWLLAAVHSVTTWNRTRVTWAGVTYEVHGSDAVRVVARDRPLVEGESGA